MPGLLGNILNEITHDADIRSYEVNFWKVLDLTVVVCWCVWCGVCSVFYGNFAVDLVVCVKDNVLVSIYVGETLLMFTKGRFITEIKEYTQVKRN